MQMLMHPEVHARDKCSSCPILMAQNFVTKFHENLFSHSQVMCTHAGGQIKLF
jgi:hypothetical protein